MACNGRNSRWNPGRDRVYGGDSARRDIGGRIVQATSATSEGTLRYVQSQPEARQANYRETVDGLSVSSIGLGTYLGEPDNETDDAYQAAFSRAMALGCNVIDCGINYRFQRSERAVGAWLGQAIANGTIRRDEIVIATKGGFV